MSGRRDSPRPSGSRRSRRTASRSLGFPCRNALASASVLATVTVTPLRPKSLATACAAWASSSTKKTWSDLANPVSAASVLPSIVPMAPLLPNANGVRPGRHYAPVRTCVKPNTARLPRTGRSRRRFRGFVTRSSRSADRISPSMTSSEPCGSRTLSPRSESVQLCHLGPRPPSRNRRVQRHNGDWFAFAAHSPRQAHARKVR
jgi:hypothetical protein